MTAKPDVVFLGPSLSRADALALYPDVVVLPPAAMGDVLGAANRYRPHAIGIVDGTFLSNMSVFHKEILYAMDQGIWVLGSSSMGALRAAECAAYGMIGVGGIYEQIASGAIEDDDEVALTHADSAQGFRALSDALVTIKAAIGSAVETGLISHDEGVRLISLQKERWFPDRRLSSVSLDAMSLGIDPERCASIREFMRTQVIDPKREDAIALLHRMRELPEAPIPVEDRPDTAMSGTFLACLARDVVVETPDGFAVTFDRIRRYADLHEDRYEEDMSRARQAQALISLSQFLGGPPTLTEFAIARAAVCRRVGITEDSLESFALDNDLDARGLRVLIGGQALIMRLERSWLGRSRMGMITEAYLNELRMDGRYADTKAGAALQHAAAEGITFDSPPSPRALIATQEAIGWQVPEDFAAYIDERELGSASELLDAIAVSVRAHRALFGIDLIDVGDDSPLLIEDSEPMMTRGR